MTLKDEIKKLEEVQAVDSRIYFLQNEKENEIPSQIENVKKNFEESKKILETVVSRTKELQVKKKEKELDLATKEEGVKKAQGQLYQLKSNKEYQAKLT